ncbi:MAG: hypothetical protein ACFCVD_08485 [Nodosilinea sp.]
MARYTNLLTFSKAIPGLRDSIVSSLESCGLSMIYETGDYFVAKEKPGQVSLSQLTTIEVLINPPTQTLGAAKVNLVVKNEELPLNQNNHCQRVFEAVNQAIVALV